MKERYPAREGGKEGKGGKGEGKRCEYSSLGRYLNPFGEMIDALRFCFAFRRLPLDGLVFLCFGHVFRVLFYCICSYSFFSLPLSFFVLVMFFFCFYCIRSCSCFSSFIILLSPRLLLCCLILFVFFPSFLFSSSSFSLHSSTFSSYSYY